MAVGGETMQRQELHSQRILRMQIKHPAASPQVMSSIYLVDDIATAPLVVGSGVLETSTPCSFRAVKYVHDFQEPRYGQKMSIILYRCPRIGFDPLETEFVCNESQLKWCQQGHAFSPRLGKEFHQRAQLTACPSCGRTDATFYDIW